MTEGLQARPLREKIAETVMGGHHGEPDLGPCPGCWAAADALLAEFSIVARGDTEPAPEDEVRTLLALLADEGVTVTIWPNIEESKYWRVEVHRPGLSRVLFAPSVAAALVEGCALYGLEIPTHGPRGVTPDPQTVDGSAQLASEWTGFRAAVLQRVNAFGAASTHGGTDTRSGRSLLSRKRRSTRRSLAREQCARGARLRKKTSPVCGPSRQRRHHEHDDTEANDALAPAACAALPALRASEGPSRAAASVDVVRLHCVWCGRDYEGDVDSAMIVGQVCSERCRRAWSRAAEPASVPVTKDPQ